MSKNNSFSHFLRNKSHQEVRDLVTHLNLKYGEDLYIPKKRAFAQACAKALCILGGGSGHSDDKIKECVKSLLGVRRLGNEPIYAALSGLRVGGYATRGKRGWKATRQLTEKIALDTSSEESRRTRIIEAYWGKIAGIASEEILAWYIRAAAEVFSEFGRQWLFSISRASNSFTVSYNDVETVLRRTVKEAELDRYGEDLVDGFHKFMRDTSEDPAKERWHLGRSMFYAQIVAYSQAADPLAVDEFRSTRVILDTNVIVMAILERQIEPGAFKKLIEVLSSLGSPACFVVDTYDEYNRLLDGQRANCMKLWQAYDESVIALLTSDFVVAAHQRGAKDCEDIQRFFEELSDVKQIMYDEFGVIFEDTQDFEGPLQRGRDDASAIEKIRSERAESRKPKTMSAGRHDSAISELIDSLRRDSGQKSLMLTMDFTLVNLAKRWKNADGMPFCLSIDSVLQVLAVDGDGPAIPEEMVATLMAQMLRSQIYQDRDFLEQDELFLLADQLESTERLDRDTAERLILKSRESLGSTVIARREELAHQLRIALQEERKRSADGQLHVALDRARRSEDRAHELQEQARRSDSERDAVLASRRMELGRRFARQKWAKLGGLWVIFLLAYALLYYYGRDLTAWPDLYELAKTWPDWLILGLKYGVFGIPMWLTAKIKRRIETKEESYINARLL